MESWIGHQKYIRRFNMSMIAMMIIGLVVVLVVGGPKIAGIIFLVEVVIGGLFIGMVNVALLLGTPPVNASDEEIREVASTGPAWLKRLVDNLDDHP